MGLICPKQFRWDHGRIPYAFDRNFEERIEDDSLGRIYPKELIVSCFQRWEYAVNTNFTDFQRRQYIQFVERDVENFYVLLTSSHETNAGCVGMTAIKVNHGAGPTFFIRIKGGLQHVPHEVGHIIGLCHEHNRPESLRTADPTKWESAGVTGDRAKSAARGDVSVSHYDISSIMHYPGGAEVGAQWSAGKPGQDVTPRPGFLNIPDLKTVNDGRWRPSHGDIQAVRALYA